MSWLSRKRRRIEFARRQVPVMNHRRFENPLFPKKEQAGLFNGRGKYYIIITFIGLIYFLFWSGYFKIYSVSISGIYYLTDNSIRPIADDYLVSKKWYILPQNNLIFTDTGNLNIKISENLKNQFALSSIDIKKNYPDALEIKITERIPSLTWVNNNITYYLDLSGKVTKRLEENETIDPNFPKIYDLVSKEINLNDSVVTPEIISFIFTISSELSQKLKNTQVTSWQYDPIILPDLWLTTNGKWRILLDTNRSPSDQIDDTVLILNEYFKEDQAKLDYIDARIADRVYYKTKY